ncbi:MAG: histidine kinase dimerization/phosphoacceptor domain -containing protein [Chitinophagaceae bacterium]
MKKTLLILGLLFSLPALAQDMDLVIKNSSTDKEKADTLFSLARKNFRKGRFDSVEYWLDKGQYYAERTASDEIMARYLVERGNMKYMQGKFREGINNLKKATPYLAGTDSYDLHNSALLITGSCFKGLYQSDSAIYFYQLCERYNNEKFPYRNYLVYSLMAEVFSDADDYKRAEDYFQKAYTLTVAKEGKPDHGYVLTMFANFYVSWDKPGEFGEKLNEYNELMDQRKKTGGSEPSHNLLFINWSNSTLDNKVAFMEKVKESSLKTGNYLQAILANAYIIGFYEKNKQPELALTYAEENEMLSKKGGIIQNEYTSVKVKYDLLKKTGRSEEANAAADRLFALKDTILNRQRRTLMYELETKFRTEQKEKEIAYLTSQHELNRTLLRAETEKREALQRENLLKEEKLAREQLLRQALERENTLNDSSLAREQRLNTVLDQQALLKEGQLRKEKQLTMALSRENELKQESLNKGRRNKQILWAGIGLLTLAGGIILGQFSRQIKKNRIIKRQAEEMEVLNREIHHRVKNNLQVISSLLDLQSQSLNDVEATDAIKESKQRVQSMAFIHQNLYQGSAANEIKISSYIHQLAEHLFQTYNIRKDKIRFNADIEDITLHTDTAVPMGMILNELISNALKYAFKDLEDGEIHVEMKRKEHELYLRVKDNGRGLPPNFDISRQDSFGYKVVRAFVQKLKGRLTIDGSRGTDVQLFISKYKTA